MGCGSSCGHSNLEIINRFKTLYNRQYNEEYKEISSDNNNNNLKDLKIRNRFARFNNRQYEGLINFDLIKKGDFNVNLIYYNRNLRSSKNMEYYRYFSINIIGSYYAIDDFDILKLLISKIREIPFTSSYILLMSEDESEKIIKEFNDLDFIMEFIIFYENKNNFLEIKEKYEKIKLITDDFTKIKEYLKTKNNSKEDLDMDNHLALTPLITYYDYKKCLYPIHKILAYFFHFYRRNFSTYHFHEAIKYIKASFLEQKFKDDIIEILKKLTQCSKSEFPKACIKYYTGEKLCYIINKALRNFEKNYVELGHFIGPFYNGLFQYALDNPKMALNKKTILYRDIIMDRLDLYSYQFCERDIICFTSFTSTTLNKELNFKPTKNAKKINNDDIEQKSYVKMIISYNPKGKCIPQGLDVSNETEHPSEKEILLFPFTFLKIDKIEINTGKENDKHYIYMTIINKGDILEEGLNNRYSFKLVENGTKIIVDKENNISCDTNETYDIINIDNNIDNSVESNCCIIM